MALVLHAAVLRNSVYPEPRFALDVAIQGDRIVDLRPATMRSPRDHYVRDLAGAFPLVGLNDIHVLLVWTGGSAPANVVAAAGEQLTLVLAVEYACAAFEDYHWG